MDAALHGRGFFRRAGIVWRATSKSFSAFSLPTAAVAEAAGAVVPAGVRQVVSRHGVLRNA